jgi:sirohydrochlorin cobaltochelatase
VTVVSKGILIVGYGTRNGNLTEILDVQVNRLKCRGWEHVGKAYFRVNSPSIPEALEQMVDEGVDEIVAIPYYISEGTLTKELIPEKLGLGTSSSGKALVKGKEVTISIASAFDTSFTLTDIICDKIADANGNMDCGILILGHGTRFKALSNMRTIKMNAERVAARGYKHVGYAFNEYCDPTIPDALDRLEKEGVDRIIAIPLFIAMGIHMGKDIPEKIGIPPYSEGGDITVNGRKINVYYARPVESNPRLLDVLDQKAREYLGE